MTRLHAGALAMAAINPGRVGSRFTKRGVKAKAKARRIMAKRSKVRNGRGR